MSPSNREIQLQKNCEIYAYVLTSLGKEVSEEIQDCVDDYEYSIDCVKELAKVLQTLDTDTFNKIVNNKELPVACELANWWEMYQAYIPVPKSERDND
ncbi:MAG: hypothetical protein GQ531_08550 [Sulfurovum sp.]|nr:hypothetical protein [Sulfurovum sp.]